MTVHTHSAAAQACLGQYDEAVEQSPTVLLNAASVVVGGGVQAAVQFIRHVHRHPGGIDWRFALSLPVARQLAHFQIEPAALNARVFSRAPARDRTVRRALQNLEWQLNPALVFTFFGPAYVRFRAAHLCGVADGWVTHATRLAYRSVSARLALRLLMQGVYKGLWYRVADHWLVEASAAKRGLCSRYRIPAGRVSVIPNGCSEHYREGRSGTPLLQPNGKFRLLTFAAYYPNKNLEIIPAVAAQLARRGLGHRVEFIITVPRSEPALARITRCAEKEGVAEMITNVGPVDLRDGPRLYRSCHALFMPTLLETFSATYPEAMAMGLPIVTTDLDFAREVCGPAAHYFTARNAAAAAEAILPLVQDDDGTTARLVSSGAERLSIFPDAKTRHLAIVALVRHVMAGTTP